MGFKSNIRSRKIAVLFKSVQRKVVFPDLNQIRTIGIVMDSNDVDNKQSIDDLKRRLDAGCSISLMRVDSVSKEKATDGNTITKADLDFWGLPKWNTIDHFVTKEFDVLIHLAAVSNDVLDYIFVASVARFKVTSIPESFYSDLIVNHQSDQSVMIINELFKILENLKNRN